MKSVEQLAQSTHPAFVRAFGAIRRFVVSLTDTAIWQVAGVLMPDGREAMRAEVFGTIGVFARPPVGVEADAIGVMVGDATSPMIVGVRDEKTRAAVAGDLAADETKIYNSKAFVHVKADGTIEARSTSGVAVPLATKADIDALATFLQAMTLPVSGATAGPALAGTVPSAVGTTKWRAE